MQPLDEDIRAEVLVALWSENKSLTLDQVIIRPAGTFRRSYSKDVLAVEGPDTSKSSKIEVQIAREGLYDMLPEGMFHQATQKNQKSTKEATEETARYRKEEKAARNFFLPLEQEYYRQRIWLESAELKYWLHSAQPENVKMLLRFWKLNPRHFTHRQSQVMLSMLPNLHTIVGNLDLTAKSLGIILNEGVKINTENNKIVTIGKELHSPLGSIILGVDSVLGDSWFDDEPMVQVIIGPLKRNKIKGFLPEGKFTKLLSGLYGYFFPADVEVETSIEILEDEGEFIFNDMESTSLLGYSTFI